MGKYDDNFELAMQALRGGNAIRLVSAAATPQPSVKALSPIVASNEAIQALIASDIQIQPARVGSEIPLSAGTPIVLELQTCRFASFTYRKNDRFNVSAIIFERSVHGASVILQLSALDKTLPEPINWVFTYKLMDFAQKFNAANEIC